MRYLWHTERRRVGDHGISRTHLVFSFLVPALGMFGDPLGGLLFGGETLDYFRLAIGPKNIDHPAKSGITFSRHESGSVFGHLANMRLRRAGSSRSSDTIKTTDRHLRSTSILHLRKPLVTAWLLRVRWYSRRQLAASVSRKSARG